MTARVAAALGLLAFALYAAAAAPGVEWLDAGELTAAGFTLGISHPPGQPGHALLSRAAAMLPLGEVAFRVSLLSAAAAALAVAGVAALAAALVGREDRATAVAAGVAAVLTALSPLVFAQATRPEVYAPALALVVWGARYAVRFLRGGGAGRDALTAALLLALAAALHPLLAAAVAAPLAAAVAVALRATPRRLAVLCACAVGLALLGLAVYAYLPLRAGAADRPLFVWGEPDSWARFRDVVTAKAYGRNFAAEGLGGRLAGHLLLLGEGPGLALLFLGSVGLAFGAVTRLRGTFALAAAAALVVAGAAAQRTFFAENPDVHGYLAPAAALLAVGVAVLVVAAARIAAQLELPRGTWLAALAPVAALAALGPRVNVHDAGFRRGDDALRYHDATVGRVPPGPAVYFADSDHALFPALYERLVAGARPDVGLANRALVKSSWFLRMLDRALPELFVPFVDDGGARHDLAARLVAGNLAAGRPVGGERPVEPPPESAPLGLGFAYGTRAAVAAPDAVPARWEGELGRRAARHTGFVFARWHAAQGDWAAMARAAAVPAETGIPAGTPALWPRVALETPAFIYADWQGELVARDVAFAAGLGPGEPPAPGAPFEVRLLHAWHLVLAERPEADAALAALGPDARVTTGVMLEELGAPAAAAAQVDAVLGADPRHERALLLRGVLLANSGRLAEAEAVFRQVTELHPRSAAAWRQLGLALAKQGRPAEAATAWRTSLELDPSQRQVTDWLRQLAE